MQESRSDESLLFPSQTTVRQAPGSNAAMRKYQQLTLAVVAVVSFVAFIFYKHEYERLRYTLEYMDTFGEPPPATEVSPSEKCWFLAQSRAATPPAEWTTVSPDIAVYTSFMDVDPLHERPTVRTIALVQKTSQPPSELKVKLWYHFNFSLLASCEMEKAESRNHVVGDSKVFHIVILLCSPLIPEGHKGTTLDRPQLIQFGNGDGVWSDYKMVHYSSNAKSMEGRSALCVLPDQSVTDTTNFVEFISFYQILGFQKFVFYGNGLTHVTRDLLSRYMDEMGITVEEKSFNYIPSLQSLQSNASTLGNSAVLDYIIKQVVELDCQYRHRETFENVAVLHNNEFIIPNHKQSLQDILSALSLVGGRRSLVSEFHLSTRHVCVDTAHPNSPVLSTLRLGRQSRSIGDVEETGIAILRPSLSTLEDGPGKGVEQHVSPASAVVYRYSECRIQDAHADQVHLPTRLNFVNLIEKSFLWRKMQVYLINER